MSDLLLLAQSDLNNIEPKVLFIAGGAVVVTVWIIATKLAEVFKTRAQEQTKREIAAYVAEGSMTPDDAARLMNKPSSDFEKKVADAVAWGTIKPEKAAELIRAIREELKSEKAT